MQDTNQKESIRPMESLLVLMASGYCLVITFMLWMSVSAYQPMWPLPAFYFVEMAALSILSAYTFTQRHQVGKIIVWVAAGITSVFSLAGAMTVGFFYLPIALIFAFVAITSDLRNKQPIATHLGICLMAGLGQVALMFAAIRFLN
jgi:hypothetical protein